MEDDNSNSRTKGIQGALSLSNSVLIIGGTLFTIAGFFVSLSYRVTTVESTLRDFPLYRVENRLTSIEQMMGSMREEMRDRDKTRRQDEEDTRTRK